MWHDSSREKEPSKDFGSELASGYEFPNHVNGGDGASPQPTRRACGAGPNSKVTVAKNAFQNVMDGSTTMDAAPDVLKIWTSTEGWDWKS